MALETASRDNTLDHLGDLYLVLDVPNHEAVGYVENPDVGIDFFLLRQEAIENHLGHSTEYDNPPHDGGDREASGGTEYRFRVSSRHLCLASEYFRIMLEGPWNESVGTRQNPGVVRISSFKNPTAFLLLMKILHGFYATVPRIVPAAVLGDVTLVADYFQCLGKVAMLARTWLNEAINAREQVAKIWVEKTWVASHQQYLLAAWVFEHQDALQLAIKATIIHNPGPILSFLPFFPQALIDHINRSRHMSITRARQEINSLLEGINQIMSTAPPPNLTLLPESMDGNWERLPWEHPSENFHDRTYMQSVNCARGVLKAARLIRQTYRRVGGLFFMTQEARVTRQLEPLKKYWDSAGEDDFWHFHGELPNHPHNHGWILR